MDMALDRMAHGEDHECFTVLVAVVTRVALTRTENDVRNELLVKA